VTSILIIPSIVAVNENTPILTQKQDKLTDFIQTRDLGEPGALWDYWAKSYVLPNQDLIAKAVIENHNDYYVIAGDIREDTKRNIFLMEMDTAGAVLWFRVYDIGGSAAYDGANEDVFSIDEVRLASGDYGYVITGRTDLYTFDKPVENSMLQPGDVYVMQVNNVGDPIWLKAYKNLNHPENYQIGLEIRTCIIDGITQFFVAGSSDTPTPSNLDIIALMLDIDGNVIHYVQLDGNVDEKANAAAVQFDTSGVYSFAICGFQNPGIYGQIDPIFVELDDNLNILFARQYGIFDQNGNSQNDWLTSIQTTSAQEYIMCGSSYSHTGSNLESILVIRADDDGKPKWMRTYNEMPPNGRDNRGMAIDELQGLPDFYVLTCIRGQDPDYDLGIMGVNKTLHRLWARMLQAGKPNFPCNTNLNGVEKTFDLRGLMDGFVLTGLSTSTEAVPNTNFPGAVVCRFDDEGYIRKNPTPCCTVEYELDEDVYDEHEEISLERTLVQYEVPEWDPSFYDDTPKVRKICTPGFEAILFLGAISVIFVIIRKRRQDHQN
jgi:hypothetical protein